MTKKIGRPKGSKNKKHTISNQTQEILNDIINIEVSHLVMKEEFKLGTSYASVARKYGKYPQYLTALKKRYKEIVDAAVKERLNDLYKNR